MQTCKNEESGVTANKVIVAIFMIANVLLASLDSAGIDGIVPLMQADFGISGAETAIIKTSASLLQTATLGVMWIFGDVFGRRKLYLTSVSFWIACSLLSIVLGSESFMIFVALRSLSTVGVEVFGVLSPVIMADMFSNRALGVALMCMTASMVFGFTISSVTSSFVVSSGFPWQAGLLPWPILALLPLAGSLCLMKKDECRKVQLKKSIISGALGLFSNKSFVLMTAATSLGNFHAKAFMFWLPSMILSAWTSAPSAFLGLSYTSVTAIGSITGLAANIVGIPLVLWLAQSWYHGSGPFAQRMAYTKAYPVAVLIGSLLSTCILIVDMLILDKSFLAHLGFSFFCGIGASAEVSLGQMMLMMVLPAGNRAAATSLTRFIGGIVSTPSAQIFGFISDKFLGSSTLDSERFHAYQQTILYYSIIAFASGFSYFGVLMYFDRDCKKAQEDAENGQLEATERTSLIGTAKDRSESLLDTVIRSRTQTLQSIY